MSTTATESTTTTTIPITTTIATDTMSTTATTSITITTSTTTKIGTTNTTSAGNSTVVNKITITVATTVATTRAAVTNNDGHNDSGNISIIVGSVVGGVVFVIFLVGMIGICCCLYFCKGSPLRSNKAYVRDGLRAQKDLGNAIFQPGALAGYFYKDGAWQGPHDLTLAFYPKANHTVYGKGIDNLGTFVATGSYSPRTLRMAFEKRYQKGLGDTSQNPGQTMIIQAEWNPNTQSFEGKYYLKGEKHREEQRYMIKIANGRFRR
ncbi:unnamed protein product [Adineta steineri]|nr:unnamed protein product [Adineta steineri]